VHGKSERWQQNSACALYRLGRSVSSVFGPPLFRYDPHPLLASTSNVASEGESESDSDEEVEIPIHETDSDRRETLLSSEQNDDLQGLKSGTLWDFFQQDFITGRQGASHVNEVLDDHDTRYSGNSTSGPSTTKGKRKHEPEEAEGYPHHPHPCAG
jgi:hypothetical protein